jgi:hypothetical protein
MKMETPAGSAPVLKVGDYVTLKHSIQGWLSAEGICFDDISLSSDLCTFENCLWEIHVQNQYTALKEYEEVLFSTISEGTDAEARSTERDRDRSTVTDELLNQLHRAATNEGHLNQKLMSLKIGKPILFGDIVQLRHVKSKKFLTVYSGVLAKQERENLRIHLDSYGDFRSWLEIMPKSKGDKEGQHISPHSEVLLRIHGRTSEYLHCAKDAVEVNCSLESSPWTLAVYQDAFSFKASKILAGQVVCLQEVDSSAYLAPEGRAVNQPMPRAQGVSLTQSNLIGSSSEIVGTHLLWILENELPHQGGVIGCQGPAHSITLKHLNTGMYLTIDSEAPTGSQSIYLSLEKTASSQLNLASDSDSGLNDGATVQLKCQGSWISAPLLQTHSQPEKTFQSSQSNLTQRSSSFMPSFSFEEVEAPALPFHCSGTVERAKASSFTVKNTLHLRLGPDLFLGVEAAKILSKFVCLCQEKCAQLREDVNFTAEVKVVLTVLDLVFQFLSEDLLTDSPNEIVDEELDLFHIIETRQIMMREQGVLAAVVDLIEICGDDILSALLSQEKSIPASIAKTMSQSKISFKNLISQNSSFAPRSPFQSHRKFHSEDDRGSSPHTPSKKMLASTLSMEARRDISRTISNENVGARRNPVINRARTSRSNFGNLLSDLDSDQFPESFDDFPTHGLDHSDYRKRTLAHDLSNSCFQTLFAIIHDNHSNQMSIADKFPILLNQVKDQDLAVACVQEMLRDNLQMLETKVRHLSLFAHHLSFSVR